jgi:hypothetical protein
MAMGSPKEANGRRCPGDARVINIKLVVERTILALVVRMATSIAGIRSRGSRRIGA